MPMRKCKLCSTVFESENEKFIFCCIEHAREYKKPKKERDYSSKNPPYRPGKNQESFISVLHIKTPRNSIVEIPGFSVDWKEIAKQIRKRDSYTCQFCREIVGNSKTQLHVHHIIARKFLIDYPIELIEHPDNLISLCFKCHPHIESGKLRLPDYVTDKARQLYKKEKDCSTG